MERKTTTKAAIEVYMWTNVEMFRSCSSELRIKDYQSSEKNFKENPISNEDLEKSYALTEMIILTLPASYAITCPAMIAEAYFNHQTSSYRRERRKNLLAVKTNWIHTELSFGDIIKVEEKFYLFVKPIENRPTGILEIEFYTQETVD